MRRIVLEITRSSLRVVAVEGTRREWRLRHAAVEPLADTLDEATLRRALAPLQPLQDELIVVVPREHVITRLLKLPAARPEELRNMALLAGKAQLPLPADHTVSDVHLVAQDATTSTVQLIVCHRDVVERPLLLLRALGGAPQIITPSSWGVWSWYQRWGKTAEITEPVLLVHIDGDHTELALIHAEALVFSRSLAHGVQEWQGGGDAAAQDIQRSLEALRQELPMLDVHTVLLTGIGSLETWRPLLAQRLGLPVVVAQPSGAVPLPQPATFAQASPVVALGLAFADVETLVNLVPSDVRRQQRRGQRQRALRVTASVLTAACLVGIGLLWVLAHRRERFLAQATAVIKTLETKTAQTERREQQLRLIEHTLRARRQTAQMLEELFRLTPPDVFFEQLLFERPRGELVIRGSAPATRDVLEYLHHLEQSPQWMRVELRYSGRRNAAGPSRTEFEMVLRQRAGS